MRKYTFFLFFSFASILLAQRPVSKPMQTEVESAAMKLWLEGKPTLILKESNLTLPWHYRSSSSASIVLVDSSRNGYGMVAGNTTPLSYHPDNGFIMAYRQWLPGDPIKSGYLGAAFSEDGETFETYSHLNIDEPAETMGRYPSAVAGSDYPYIIWNEYTQPQGDGTGGGLYGGRPFYSWDEFYFGGGSFFSPPVDLNKSCGLSPCNPPDSWVGSVSLSQDGTTPVLNAAYSQWSNSQNESSGNRWLYHSNKNVSGYFSFDNPIMLFDEADFMIGGFTSNVVIDINNNGTGYAVVASYFKDQSPDSSHTLMIRKTTDYGASWSGDNGTGMKGTDYYFIPRDILKDRFFNDSLMIENRDTLVFESPFISYEVEAKTDASGGLHIFSTVIPSNDLGVYPSIDESCGIYHFYSSDPSNPDSWNVHFVKSTQVSFFWDNNWHRIYPSAAISKDDPSVMYVSYMAVSDTTETYFNYDVFIQRSIDGGKSWETPINVTDTRDRELDEVFPQLASVATDHEAYLMFESPDYNVQTVTPDDGSSLTQADFKNRIYFAKVTLKPLTIEDPSLLPDLIDLAQNYPNPFNPTTVIEFTVPEKGDVSLTVYDLLGNEVATLQEGPLEAGHHTISWNGAKSSAGIYFYRLQSGGVTKTKKMILIK